MWRIPWAARIWWKPGPRRSGVAPRELVRKVDSLGGAVAAIEQGFFQREIEDAAYAAQREIEEGRRLVVGVNAFREAKDTETPILAVDPNLEAEQIARLRAFRASRDTAAARGALETLQEHAREDRNLMPALIEAVGQGRDARRDHRLAQGDLRRASRRQLRRSAPALKPALSFVF